MPLYESTFIIHPNLTAQEVRDVKNSFVSIIESYNGSLLKEEYWGLRSLAYEIKKHNNGHYIMLNLDASGDAIKELERKFKLDERILRFITFRINKLDENPSVMMQSPSNS